MELAIVIPMTDKRHGLLPDGWEDDPMVAWPELSIDDTPRMPATIAREVERVILGWGGRNVPRAVLVTRSEVAVLVARRIVAEGAPITLTIHFPGSDFAPVTVGSNGEVGAWPEGLFGEAFSEVKRIRRAQRRHEDPPLR